jgi:hypothetical protein
MLQGIHDVTAGKVVPTFSGTSIRESLGKMSALRATRPWTSQFRDNLGAWPMHQDLQRFSFLGPKGVARRGNVEQTAASALW